MDNTIVQEVLLKRQYFANTTSDGLEKMINYLKTQSDPRTEKWLLLGGPEPLAAIILLYLLVVWIAPKLMENREPFQLRLPIILYNIGLTLLSVYMFYEVVVSAYLAGYSFGCQPVDYSDNPLALRMARVCWLYFFSKIIEVADTIFVILRKKDKQLTFLHVYHHTTMMVNWYLGAKYIAGGQSFLVPLLNTFVHTWMYSYYGLAAIGPHMQKYLWWKRYLTRMQLTQFIIGMVHSLYSIVAQCDFPQGFNWAVVIYGNTLLMLFGNYYHQEYVVRAGLKAKKA